MCDILPCVVEQKQLIVQLVLVLFLLLLPANHLIPHLLGCLVDVDLEDLTLGLHLSHSFLKFSLYLLHTFVDYHFDVLLCQTLLLLVLLTIFTILVVNLTVFFSEQLFLEIYLEFEALRHFIIDNLYVLKYGASTNIGQNLLLHLHVENCCRFFHPFHRFIVEECGYELLDCLNSLNRQVPFNVVLKS